MLNSFQVDQAAPCCRKRMEEILNDWDSRGLAGLKSWSCGKCGQEWRPYVMADMRHWMPYCPVEVM